MIGAMRTWTDTLAQREPGPRLETDGQRRTPDQLRALLEEACQAFSAEVRRRPLEEMVTRHLRDGSTRHFTRGAVVTHVATHGMHHRAQCLNMLRQLGLSPLPPSSVSEWTWLGVEPFQLGSKLKEKRIVSNDIRFDDGAAYERYMGKWSQLAGNAFLDWLAPQPRLRWLDVGCGNGAFTEMLVERCAPAMVQGIDPSEEQLAFARTRCGSHVAQFRQGNAMALPSEDDTFDAAVMPLVIFFVPDPARGVAEMARVVRPGGAVTAYAWDMPGGGFPYETLHAELRALGVSVPEQEHFFAG